MVDLAEEAVKVSQELHDWTYRLLSACNQIDKTYGELADIRQGLEVISGNLVELFRQLEAKKADDLPLRSKGNNKL